MGRRNVRGSVRFSAAAVLLAAACGQTYQDKELECAYTGSECASMPLQCSGNAIQQNCNSPYRSKNRTVTFCTGADVGDGGSDNPSTVCINEVLPSRGGYWLGLANGPSNPTAVGTYKGKPGKCEVNPNQTRTVVCEIKGMYCNGKDTKTCGMGMNENTKTMWSPPRMSTT